MIVGLDIATETGFASWQDGAPAPTLDSLRFPSAPFEVGVPMERLRRALVAMHNVDPITMLFFEEPILAAKTTAATVFKLNALAGMAEWFATKVGATVRQVRQQNWRKHFIGRGTGPSDVLKAMAIDACRLRGWDPRNDHEADAAGVLDYGLACFGIHAPWRDAHLMAPGLRRVA